MKIGSKLKRRRLDPSKDVRTESSFTHAIGCTAPWLPFFTRSFLKLFRRGNELSIGGWLRSTLEQQKIFINYGRPVTRIFLSRHFSYNHGKNLSFTKVRLTSWACMRTSFLENEKPIGVSHIFVWLDIDICIICIKNTLFGNDGDEAAHTSPVPTNSLFGHCKKRIDLFWQKRKSSQLTVSNRSSHRLRRKCPIAFFFLNCTFQILFWKKKCWGHFSFKENTLVIVFGNAFKILFVIRTQLIIARFIVWQMRILKNFQNCQFLFMEETSLSTHIRNARVSKFQR